MNHDRLVKLLYDLREFLPLLIFLVVGPLAVFLSYRRRKRCSDKLKDLAVKLGLQWKSEEPWHLSPDAYRQRLASLKPGERARAEAAVRRWERSGLIQSLRSMMQPLAIGGRYNGYQVEVALVHREKKNLTEVRAWYPEPLGLGLSITRRGFWNRRLSLAKSDKAETGNAELDRMVEIRAKDRLRASYLAKSVQVQLALRDIFQERDIECDDRGILVRWQGYQTDYGKIKGLLDRMTRAMQSVAAAVGAKQNSE